MGGLGQLALFSSRHGPRAEEPMRCECIDVPVPSQHGYFPGQQPRSQQRLVACNWQKWSQMLFLAMMICWNCEFGQNREHCRKHQLHEAMATLYARTSPSRVPLFQNMLHELVKEFEAAGVQFDSAMPMAEQVWNHMKSKAFHAVGLSRCNLNRFCGSVHTASARRKRWAWDLFERSFLGIECDFLGSKKMVEKITFRTSAASDVVPEAGASTSSKVITFDDRQSISFCSNAVQTSYVMLHNFDNRRTIDIVLSPALECMAWHTDSNRAGRSAHDALEWNI